MTDVQQLNAWMTLMGPAFTALLVLAICGVVAILVSEIRQRQ